MKQPTRTNLSDFIKTTLGSQFVIPVYQRIYTWHPEKETKRFMYDIAQLLSKQKERHFLGIIMHRDTTISTMFKQSQIVDGQQRLTTTFIFILALKKLAQENHNTQIQELIDVYYLYNHFASERGKLRLKPAVSSDDVFERLVYGNASALTRQQKESAVYRNYIYIYKCITQFLHEYSFLEVLDTLSRLDILDFPLSDYDDVQQIFESINSTGAPLTSADLIRNYILMNHSDDEQERYYKMYWQPLENQYPESRKLEEFFRYFLAIKTYDLYNRKDVYEGFKKYWVQDKRSAEVKLQEINRYCRYYTDIYIGPCENAELEDVMVDFRISDYRTPACFLMEMYRLFEDGQLSLNDMKAEVRLIDSYLMRRALCGNDSSPLSRYFPTLLRNVCSVYEKNKRKNILMITKMQLINANKGKTLEMPSDERLRSELREINAYSLMCIRTVLERIEHFGAHAKVDTSNLNIEHIMPQHPNNYWKQVSLTKDEDEYTYYANLIGNLTLCAQYDNTKMGNENFNYKKEILSNTLHIRLNTPILKLKKWNKDTILKRCDALSDIIIQIYPYSGANQQVDDIANENIYTLNAPTVNVRAIFHSHRDVEILAGSTMKAYGEKEMKHYKNLFQTMDEAGVFHEIENGKIQFTKSYHFKDVYTASQFLLHRGGDNRGLWKKEQLSSSWKKSKSN